MTMTALEYMEKRLRKHRENYRRERDRGVSDEMLKNIQAKISYYESAVEALRELLHCEKCRYHFDLEEGDICRRFGLNAEIVEMPVTPDGFCAWGESREGSI